MIVNLSAEDSEYEIEFSKQPFTEVYDVLSELGRGKYAVVKRCVQRSTGVTYAAKFLHKRRRGRDCRADALHEVRMLQRTGNHPRVVHLVELYETCHDFILVTEFVSDGELFQYIESEGTIDERMTVRLMRQILEGVAYLHSLNILHLDVKPQNILLNGCLSDGEVKLCDFGLSRPFNAKDEVVEMVGTLDYVAPEVLDYVSLDSACDMWSVGVLAYVMLTGCSPFAGNSKQETMLNISQVNLEFPDELFSSVSDDAIDFIRKLLTKDAAERMSSVECLQHQWLKQHDERSLTIEQSLTQSISQSPSLPRCRTKSPITDSPSGQRRVLASTLADDEVLSSHKPVKKCRCDADVDLQTELATSESNPHDNDAGEDKENCVSVVTSYTLTTRLENLAEISTHDCSLLSTDDKTSVSICVG